MQNLELLKNVKTPAFVYSHEALASSKARLQSVLDNLCEGNWIAYSYKTNPLLAPMLNSQGCAMQVTSVAHLMNIQSFVAPEVLERSFYCSGSLTLDDARLVVESGLYIVVDSISQLQCIDHASELVGQTPRVLIRVDAGQGADDSPFGTSGMLQGVDIRDLEKVLVAPYEHVRIVGVHNHFGSQVTSLDAWRKNIENIATVLRDLDYPLEVLNLGGGTPIDYDAVQAPSIEQIYDQCLISPIRAIISAHPKLKVVIEPGRFLVGPCGFLVATATNLHQSNTQQGANLDASLFASFQDRFLSSLSFQLPVIEPQASETAARRTVLRGSSPASIDYFGVYQQLPEISLGDKVIFGMAGAYASSMGSTFSGVKRPAEYLLQNGKLEMLSHAH